MEEKREYSSFGWAEAATPDDIINAAIRQGIENMVNTSSIARVTAVNENTVDLELLNGDKVINVPLCASAFNGWTISLPIKQDDTGIVIFMKYEISDYKSTGNFAGESLSPFSQNNGLFIPFSLFNQPEITDDIIITNKKINITINKDNEMALNNEKANILIDKDGGLTFENEKGSCSFDKEGVLTVSNDGGEITMDAQGNITIKGSKAVIDANNIELGKSATEPLVLGTTFLQAINQIITLIKTHTHGSNGGGPITASPDLATGLNPLQNNILSQVSKTK